MIMPILAVKDLTASLAFYTQKLQFQEMFRMPGEDGQPTFAVLNHGETISLGLSLEPGLTTPRGEGVVLMIYVPEALTLEQFYTNVQARGVAIASPLKTEYWGDQVFSVRDPDGYYLSFCRTVKTMTGDEIIEAAKQADA